MFLFHPKKLYKNSKISFIRQKDLHLLQIINFKKMFEKYFV